MKTPSFFKSLGVFFEMIKFEHSIFALPFAYSGMLLASNGRPGFSVFIWVTVAMISFRTMAMTANRILDHKIDGENPRTSNRALPAGILSLKAAWIAAVLSFLIFEYAAFSLNELCFLLSPVPVALAWLYPLLKRWTWLCHLHLGLVLGIAPYGAWLAVDPSFSWVPGLMLAGVLFWVAGFDIIYALQDETFDRKKGLFSIPAEWGELRAKQTAGTFHGLAFLSWIVMGILARSGAVFFIGMAVIAGLLVWEHQKLRRSGEKSIQTVFFNFNAAVSVVLLVAITLDLL